METLGTSKRAFTLIFDFECRPTPGYFMETFEIRSQDPITTCDLFRDQIEVVETSVEAIAIHLADLHSETTPNVDVKIETAVLLGVQEQYRRLLLTLQNAVAALK